PPPAPCPKCSKRQRSLKSCHTPGTLIVVPIRNVVAVALPGVQPFELGVVSEGFGIDRRDDGVPNYDFAVVSVDSQPVPTSNGWTITTEHRLDRADAADLVVIHACGTRRVSPARALCE